MEELNLLSMSCWERSNQEGSMMAVKQHTQPFLVSASASALLFHKMHKPLLARLAHMTAQLVALSLSRSACWAVLVSHPPCWIELRGSGSTEIVLSGTPLDSNRSHVHTHQRQFRQRNVDGHKHVTCACNVTAHAGRDKLGYMWELTRLRWVVMRPHVSSADRSVDGDRSFLLTLTQHLIFYRQEVKHMT